MEPSPFLKNRGIGVKKPFSLRTLFNLFFAISLGLNVYFLAFQNGSGPLDNVYATGLEEEKIVEEGGVGLHAVMLNREFLNSGLTENIHEEDPIPSFNPPGDPSHKVKQVLFDSSSQSNESNIQALRLKVRNSLNYTVCQEIKLKNECGSLAAHLARLLAWFLDVNREMRNGDVLNVVYEQLNDEDQFKILQLTYKSSYMKKTVEANFYKEIGMKYGGYFDRSGREITQRIVERQSPIDEYIEITSLPGDFRKKRRGHSGTDFKAEVGTPVRATFDGRVTRTSWNVRANGYCIEIDHPRQKVKTRYLHLSRVLAKRGQYVKQGEIIAESGNTGHSFAPHLHYEVRGRGNKNTVYNPFDFKYHKVYRRNISSQRSEEFQKTISAYDALFENNKVGENIQAG